MISSISHSRIVDERGKALDAAIRVRGGTARLHAARAEWDMDRHDLRNMSQLQNAWIHQI